MKVKKGSIVTNISDKNIEKYVSNGWEIVVNDNKETSKFDKYTEEQVIDIAHDRGLVADTKEQAIEMLGIITTEEEVSNEGFTDNLIK